MTTEFLQHLTPHDLILTANSRLTRYLINEYPKHHPESAAWETPKILPLQTWLEHLFYETNQCGTVLLSDFQAQCVWEEIVQKTALSQILMQPAQLAKLTQQAYDLLTQWQLTTDALLPFAEQSSVQFLITCISAFQNRCNEKNWISPAKLPHTLQERHAQKPLLLPDKIYLVGFDDLNPSVQTFFHTLEKSIIIETRMIEVKDNTVSQIICEDTEHELKTMAAWAKTQLTINPAARIGCVIPELANLRPAVQRIFTQVFAIETLLPQTTTTVAPFNISAGKSLAQHPMIHTALTLLKWCHHALPIESLASLLQSPYVCQNDADVNMGAQLDFLLRKRNSLQINISDLFSVIPTLQSHYPDNTWLTRLRKLLQLHQEKKSQKQSLSAWTTHFIALLKTMGWPGNRTQHSDEFQLLERFKKTCLTFSQCELLYTTLSEKRALQLFSTLLHQTIFQPKSHREPIQIMGVLEASGIEFDALWVMGLHDGAWPLATKPHPLIPYEIQQTHHMPHATAKRELQFAQQMTQRLQNAANIVIFSSPAKNGDQHYSPSRLLHSFPLISLSALSIIPTTDYCKTIFASRELESLQDDHATCVQDFSKLRGGSRILQLQALCPFKAFSTIRLAAEVMNTPALGIPANSKGTLIHQILCELWETLGDQRALLALTDDELTQLIAEKINHVFNTHAHHFAMHHQLYFFSVEKKRLQHVLFEWMCFEKTRPPFRVTSREASDQITINTLPLSVRLDRVDELSDGSLLLIDYKTGKTSVNNWLEERLTDPQLPLYAVFNSNQTHYDGLAFAELHPGNMKLKGLIHEDHQNADDKLSELTPIHRVKNNDFIQSWDALQAQWKTSIETLATEFCSGVATPTPSKKTVCDTCDLYAVCRIQQLPEDNNINELLE